MPVDLGWLLEDRVMMVRFAGVVSDEDMDALDAFLIDNLDRSQQPFVHFVIDTRAITVQTSMKKALWMKGNRHPRRGWLVTVGALKHAPSRFIVGAMTTMFKVRHRDVETPKDAIDILQRMDPNLPELDPARLEAFYPEPVL